MCVGHGGQTCGQQRTASESALAFLPVGPSNRAQVVRLGGKHLPAKVAHWPRSGKKQSQKQWSYSDAC